MRKLLLTFSCCIAFVFSQAQTANPPRPIDPRKDFRMIDGYKVSLKPAPMNTYLFEIWKGNKMEYFDMMNPVTMQPEGFKTQDDAYKVAGWMIKNSPRRNGLIEGHIPPHVVQELKISDPFSKQPKF
jgi:hypothetical protein